MSECLPFCLPAALIRQQATCLPATPSTRAKCELAAQASSPSRARSSWVSPPVGMGGPTRTTTSPGRMYNAPLGVRSKAPSM